MPQPSYNVHATAITAYAVTWGLMMKLGERGILTPQEIIDSLDLSLAFVEENAGAFDDQTATNTARKLLESLIKTVGETKPQSSSGTQ